MLMKWKLNKAHIEINEKLEENTPKYEERGRRGVHEERGYQYN